MDDFKQKLLGFVKKEVPCGILVEIDSPPSTSGDPNPTCDDPSTLAPLGGPQPVDNPPSTSYDPLYYNPKDIEFAQPKSKTKGWFRRSQKPDTLSFTNPLYASRENRECLPKPKTKALRGVPKPVETRKFLSSNPIHTNSKTVEFVQPRWSAEEWLGGLKTTDNPRHTSSNPIDVPSEKRKSVQSNLMTEVQGPKQVDNPPSTSSTPIDVSSENGETIQPKMQIKTPPGGPQHLDNPPSSSSNPIKCSSKNRESIQPKMKIKASPGGPQTVENSPSTSSGPLCSDPKNIEMAQPKLKIKAPPGGPEPVDNPPSTSSDPLYYYPKNIEIAQPKLKTKTQRRGPKQVDNPPSTSSSPIDARSKNRESIQPKMQIKAPPGSPQHLDNPPSSSSNPIKCSSKNRESIQPKMKIKASPGGPQTVENSPSTSCGPLCSDPKNIEIAQPKLKTKTQRRGPKQVDNPPSTSSSPIDVSSKNRESIQPKMQIKASPGGPQHLDNPPSSSSNPIKCSSKNRESIQPKMKIKASPGGPQTVENSPSTSSGPLCSDPKNIEIAQPKPKTKAPPGGPEPVDNPPSTSSDPLYYYPKNVEIAQPKLRTKTQRRGPKQLDNPPSTSSSPIDVSSKNRESIQPKMQIKALHGCPEPVDYPPSTSSDPLYYDPRNIEFAQPKSKTKALHGDSEPVKILSFTNPNYVSWKKMKPVQPKLKKKAVHGRPITSSLDPVVNFLNEVMQLDKDPKVVEKAPTTFQNFHRRSSKSALSSPPSESSRPSDVFLPVIRDKKSPVYTCDETDPADDEKILESIDPIYFSSNDFDPKKHELKNLPEVIDSVTINKDYKKLRQQHNVVSKKVLQLIVQKQSIFNAEFERILDIQEELQLSLRICREGRSSLNEGKQQFTTASLGILANYRKRQVVQGLLHSLNTIKTLQRTDERLQELLREENYHGALSLLLECQSAAHTYRHFTCVAALAGKLQETLLGAEDQLDRALAKVCICFDGEHYSKVQGGYSLLGKTQMAMDQLHMNFSSAIHSKAFDIVKGFVQSSRGASEEEIDRSAQKMQFKQLCKCVPSENFISCLLNLCKALWEIMKRYTQVKTWHSKNSELASNEQPPGGDFEASVNQQYIQQKLENGTLRIWHDVQARVSVFLLGSDLSWYKFEQILQVLGIVHRLMEVGEEFCGSKSEELLNSIRHQSGNYFKNYHRARLDEIRIFLENDGWEICPVIPNFTCLQLQEFHSLRHVLRSWKPRPTTATSPDGESSAHSQDGSSAAGGFFARYAETGTPFDAGTQDVDTQDEDILANIEDQPSGYYSDESDEDIPEELKKDFVDENTGDSVVTPRLVKAGPKKAVCHGCQAPIVTNTTLTMLRLCGKYLQMSRLLQPIAADVIAGMTQLFEYYLYTVHSFFASDLPVPNHSLYSLKLQSTLKRIEDNLIISDRSDVHDADGNQSRFQDKIQKSHLSSVVELKWKENLYGLCQRIVAVESTLFLAQQFVFLRGYLEHLIPTANRPHLKQFFDQTVAVTSELRRPVYMSVSFRSIDVRNILTLMAKGNWEIKEVVCQHSQYVDILLREINLFSKRFEETATKIPVSKEVYDILWDNVIKICCNTFVEGFSNAKKCSNGGRALMQLDFTQFLTKLEPLTSLRPIPYRDHVEVYVKAYYLPDTSFESWLREHNEYSCKQLLGLVTCAYQNNKKCRQRLTAMIEDMEKFGR